MGMTFSDKQKEQECIDYLLKSDITERILERLAETIKRESPKGVRHKLAQVFAASLLGEDYLIEFKHTEDCENLGFNK